MRPYYGCGFPSSVFHCVIYTDTYEQQVDTPVQQLETYLDRFSNPSIHQSIVSAKLEVWNVVITRRLIALLLPLLVCCSDDEEAAPGRGSTRRLPPVRFSSVSIQQSTRFLSASDMVMAEQGMDVCTHEDKVSFLAALACGPTDLSIVSDCPDIVSNLLQLAEIDRLDVKSLMISQRRTLRDVEYARLGAIIQRSVQIKSLTLRVPFVNAPRDFYDNLGNTTHVQTLKLHIHGWMLKPQREEIISNLVVGEDGNGVVGRRLRNPRNQLTHLALHLKELDDDNLTALAQLLPTSHVKKIDLSQSNIQPPGLLELFRQLPNTRTLNSIAFQDHKSIYPLEARVKCGATLLQGFLKNPYITEVSYFNHFPQHLLLWHYYTLNRAGRRILTLEDGPPIPDGLWPIILARAGNLRTIRVWDENYHAAANAVNFFLQNFPKLCSYCIRNPDKCEDTAGSSILPLFQWGRATLQTLFFHHK